jgi:error-prone DNA polymerase
VLVYVSAWIKCYYPAVFACALLNSQPMGFYAPAQLVRDLREHKGEVRPVDVNSSRWDCTLEPASDGAMALRLGFRMLKGFSEVDAARIVAAAPFCSLEDFAARTELSRSAILRLARGDAFASLKLDRRAAVWEALKEQEQQTRKPRTKRSRKADPRQMCLFGADDSEVRPVLPELSVHEEVLADYRTVSLSLKGHPVSMIRDELDRRRVSRTADLKTIDHGRYLRVAGVVLVRQRPGTAKGITFITLEDETGIANLIVRPEIMDRYRKAARTAAVLIAHGSLEKHGEVIHVMVNRLESASDLLRPLASQSRDFR